MRLLNANTLRLEEFAEEKKIPYAILSHTWSGDAKDEVTLQDLNDGNVEKPGYNKIKSCCDQALSDNLEWVWVDTWYRGADVCYAYLADVGDNGLDINQSSHWSFSRSRWFTRGWTLQELIAPLRLVFFSKNWNLLGTKEDMARSGSLLSKVTRIDKKFLLMRNAILTDRSDSPSIAQIMSWAATRETTKIEDVAYCLLGLFDINMPLLYGEGTKAFFRLQEELLKFFDDHTLFAWGTELEKPLPIVDLDVPYSPFSREYVTSGMLAPNPSVFLGSGNIHRELFPHKSSDQNEWGGYISPALIVHRGVRIELPIVTRAEDSPPENGKLDLPYSGPELAMEAVTYEKFIFAVIACSIDTDPKYYLGISLCATVKPDEDATGKFRRLHRGTILIPRDRPEIMDLSRVNIFTVLHIEGR